MSSKTAILLAAAALGGCSTLSKTGSAEDTNFGDATRATMAAQIIDPDPQYEYLDPATSGEKAAQAVDRHRKGMVKRPERVRSTASASGN